MQTQTHEAQSCHEFSSETESYYYRARYYDPNPGRFLAEDPIQFIAGENFYRYVVNSPTTNTDPFGLQKKDDGWFWNSLNWLAGKLLNPPPPKPGAKQPNPINICEKGDIALFWEAGPNPYYNGNAGVKDWTAFKTLFNKRCADAKTPGKITTPYCTQAATPMGGAVAYCMCCESCEKKK